MDRFTWTRAVARSDLPAHVRYTGIALAEYWPQIHPGVDRLAADMAVSRSTVIRNLRRLETEGWIHRTGAPSGPGRGRAGTPGTAISWALEIPKRSVTHDTSF